MTEQANFIENVYIVFLFLTLLLATTIEIQWAENGFRACSFIMGLFTLVMVASSTSYALKEDIQSISVISFIAFLLSYLLPLMFNIRKLAFCDFLKGLVYVTYLSPTYVNIFTIYSISNIHDVTWGSRPTTDDSNATEKKTEKLKNLLYKNFRAQFMIFWAIMNLAVGYGIIYLNQNNEAELLLYFAVFLLGVMIFKIIISTAYMVKAKLDHRKVKKFIETKKSTVFDNIAEMQEKEKEEVFVVYFDQASQKGNMRISTANDPAYKKSQLKSSVKSQNIYRGFSVADLNTRHRISQGLSVNQARVTNMIRGTNGSFMKYYEDDDSSSSEHDDPISSISNGGAAHGEKSVELKETLFPNQSWSTRHGKYSEPFDSEMTK